MAETEIWTVARCLNWCVEFLKRRGEENPRVAAEWLLCSATGFKRIELYMNHDQPLGADELATVRNGLLRRKEGEPLQYITGETGFRMLTIACEPGVLIPRPETELLVDAVLTYIDQEVLGGDAARKGVRTKTELPWNDEVERTREAELARAAARADADEAVEERKAVGGGEAGFAAEVAADSENGPAADAAGMAVSLSDGRPGAAAQSGAALDGDDSTGAGFELADVSAASAPDAAAAHDEVGGGASGASADRAVAAGSVDGAGIEVAPDGDSAPRSEARVLEVGCGTGCISLSLASERKGAVRCVAIDIEPRAVALTERNREKAGLTAREVDVRLGDLIGPVLPDELGTFDVLVSNPPYIPTDVMATLPREVAAYEPSLALDGGLDGLDVFRRLLVAAPRVLRSGGLLACELFEESLDAAAALCRSAGLVNIRIAPDLTGRTRFVLATLP